MLRELAPRFREARARVKILVARIDRIDDEAIHEDTDRLYGIANQLFEWSPQLLEDIARQGQLRTNLVTEITELANKINVAIGKRLSARRVIKSP